MIPTRIFFQIHDLRRLLMIYSLNEFLRGHFVSFCIVFLECSSFYFHPELYRFLDHCFSVSSSFFVLLNIKHQCHWRNKRTISPECTKNGGRAPPEKKIVIPWIDRNSELIRLFCCAFLRDSLFMIPEPKFKDS